ncbi:adenylate/guanylate cyclase catalytic domain protein [Candidatus Magnetoovum chiemensis]|nr:adenylate/guanylate cyclase catalytic domain protein [Candidatus Magnetoovum chiemensis]
MLDNVEHRLKGTQFRYILLEYFTNTAYYPIVNAIIELLNKGEGSLFKFEPSLYVLMLTSIVQAYFIGRWNYKGAPRPFVGNLISPALYSAVEIIEYGSSFFTKPTHQAYLAFSLVIALIQHSKLRVKGRAEKFLTIVENIVRTSILLAGYWIFEAMVNAKYSTLDGFLSDREHFFVLIVIPLMGAVIGFANMSADNYLSMLQKTARQMAVYSEWLLGRDLLSKAVLDPNVLNVRRVERTILFMDIRGFTQWSEYQPPEKVMELVNDYYEHSDKTLSMFNWRKVKFSADEIMVIFSDTEEAVRAALSLNKEIAQNVLAPFDLSVGVGIHAGDIVEGIIGSRNVKIYDCLGDTVNTASRLCKKARGCEILISEYVYSKVKSIVNIQSYRFINVKGKKYSIKVYNVTDQCLVKL